MKLYQTISPRVPATGLAINRLLATGFVICALLATGADSDARPLGDAAKAGDLERVRQLIDKGAKLNARTGHGTPLHWAVLHGHNEVAAFLLARGAKVNVKTIALGAPLHTAATQDNVAMARLLLKHGADPDIRTHSGYTPLHNAAERGNVGVIRVLLDHGADVNALSNPSVEHNLYRRAGISPLHLAASGNHTTAVAMLREAGIVSPPLEPLAPFIKTASAERGQDLFVSFGCGSCHARDPNELRSDQIGPILGGVVGRPVASLPGYNYSTALRNLGGIWDEERIYAFISQPIIAAPGTKMLFEARGDLQKRADLIAYLRSLGAVNQ